MRQYAMATAVVPTHLTPSCADDNASDVAPAKASLTFGIACARSMLATLEASLPALDDAQDGHGWAKGGGQATLCRGGDQKRADARERAEENAALAVWHACKALAQQLPRVCFLAMCSPASAKELDMLGLATSAAGTSEPGNERGVSANDALVLPDEAKELCERLQAVAGRALQAWARLLSRRCIRTAAVPSSAAATAATVTAQITEVTKEPPRIHWRAVPLESGAASSGAAIALPQRPTDLTVGRVWLLLKELRLASAVPLHPTALAVFAQEAKVAIAEEFSSRAVKKVAAACEAASEIPDSLMQLLFDLRYLEHALGASQQPLPSSSFSATATFVASATGTSEPSLASLRADLAKLAKRIDPIAHTLAEKPLGHAVNASLSTLATLLHPLASVNEQPLAKTHAQISSGDGNGGIFRLPPSCARFSPLPIQTPSLHAKRVPLQSAANESGADTVSARQRTISGAGYNSSGAAVSATAAAAAAAAASYLNADIDTRAFASGVLSKVGGVLSNAGARVSGAEATQRARERVTGVTEKVSVFAGAALGGRVLGGLGAQLGLGRTQQPLSDAAPRPVKTGTALNEEEKDTARHPTH